MDKFYFTQTALKDLENETTCPARWNGLWRTKENTFPSNDHMDKGKYFEYYGLGGSAKDDIVTDLPRTFNGKKTAEHTRIDAQIERFKSLTNPSSPEFLGHTITATQVKIRDEETERDGTIDFVTSDRDNDIWIDDLKLTNDLESTRTPYSWGHPWNELDMLQLIHYADLFEKETGIRPRTALWVFDYSPKMNIKVGEIVISDKARREKDYRFESAVEVVGLYEQHGWSKSPSEKECSMCKLVCDKRFNANKKIEIFKVFI